MNFMADIDGTLSFLMLAAGAWLYCRPKIAAWRASRQISTLKREIEILDRLRQAPSARAELAQERVFWVFFAIGCWMMLQAMQAFPVGHQIVPVSHWLFGGLVYLIAMDTLGKMRRIRFAPDAIEELRSKLTELEARSRPKQ